jgi:hypothetical protein
MKRCSTCKRTYTDANLSFCIDDGTPLTVTSDDESTVVSPRAHDTSSGGEWNPAPPYQPPRPYVPPGTGPKRRRVWPWLVGIGGAFILGIVALSIAAVFLAPKLLRQSEPPIVVGDGDREQPQNSNAEPPPAANSDAGDADVAAVDIDAKPPTDHDQVLAQLTDLEREWTIANFTGDKRKLSRVLADDYVGSDERGRPQSKAQYIRTARPIAVEKWEFKDLSLMLAGDRATLNGLFRFVIQGETSEFAFVDSFVWREGRWQATGSEVTPRP